jgi:hypothetical protein
MGVDIPPGGELSFLDDVYGRGVSQRLIVWSILDRVPFRW